MWQEANLGLRRLHFSCSGKTGRTLKPVKLKFQKPSMPRPLLRPRESLAMCLYIFAEFAKVRCSSCNALGTQSASTLRFLFFTLRRCPVVLE